jgi:hypothetical protein
MSQLRPQSISEIVERAMRGSQSFDPSVAEFLDEWQTMSGADRGRAIITEPAQIGAVKDTYLAALAEHLARGSGFDVPAWTEEPLRFLDRPFFAGGLESLKAMLLVESPPAFRRRLIFISANALSRTDRTDALRESAQGR